MLPFVILYIFPVLINLFCIIYITVYNSNYFKDVSNNPSHEENSFLVSEVLFMDGSPFFAAVIAFLPVLNFFEAFKMLSLLADCNGFPIDKWPIIKGNNIMSKSSTIDKALRSKKEVEELEKELINKKSKMKELKQVAKQDIEWILKEENN